MKVARRWGCLPDELLTVTRRDFELMVDLLLEEQAAANKRR